MSPAARYRAQRLMVEALWYYFTGNTKKAEQLISQALTLTYPVGDIIAQCYN